MTLCLNMIRRGLIGIITMGLMGCSNTGQAKAAWQGDYREGLVYEKGFRDMGNLAFASFSANAQDDYSREAWALAVKLEEHSHYVMQPLRDKYALSADPAIKAKLMAWGAEAAMAVMPGSFLDFIEGSAKRFVVKLKEIKALGPADDQAVLSFMVAQEQTLVDFLALYNQEQYPAALAELQTPLQAYYPNGYPQPAPRPQ